MTKRRQVKNACVNCQKACKKCDDQRPCERCVKYGLEDSCQDSARKERKKGVRRGPYSRLVDDGDSDDSDALSSTRWSEVSKVDQGRVSPAFRLKFEEKPAGNGHRQHWASERPVRTSRKKMTSYEEESFFQNQQAQAHSTVQVGAPDGSFIKALGVVCTEVLRKIEEEDLPPAVTFQEWPPQVDQHFIPVSFGDNHLGMNRTSSLSEIPVHIRHPIPVQRLINPGVFETERINHHHLGIHPTSSSPLDLSTEMNRSNFDIMTPPETPVNVSPESLKKLQEGGAFTLPSFNDLLRPIN